MLTKQKKKGLLHPQWLNFHSGTLIDLLSLFSAVNLALNPL